MPAPPSKVSASVTGLDQSTPPPVLPALPNSRSSPAPPSSVSAPRSPDSVSLPSPPSSVSLPALPFKLSLPAPPSIKSLPAPALKLSAAELPKNMSSRAVPLEPGVKTLSAVKSARSGEFAARPPIQDRSIPMPSKPTPINVNCA